MRKSDNLPVTFTKSDVEIIARETRYRGFFIGYVSIPPSFIQRRNEWRSKARNF